VVSRLRRQRNGPRPVKRPRAPPEHRDVGVVPDAHREVCAPAYNRKSTRGGGDGG